MSRPLKSLFFLVLLFAASNSVMADVSAPPDPFQDGLQSYKDKNYEKAVTCFSANLEKKPNHAASLQGRGNSYFYLGQYQKALDDFQKLDRLQPSRDTEKFIRFLQDKTGVHQPTPVPKKEAALEPSDMASPSPIALRVYSHDVFINLSDLNQSANTSQALAKQAQMSDTSTGFSALIPSDQAAVAVEPVYRLGRNFEVGLPLSLMLLASATTSETSNSLGAQVSTINLWAISIGFNARYYLDLGDILGLGHFQVDLSGGPMVAPLFMNFTGTNSTVTSTGSFAAFALGAQAQLGLGWEIFKGIVIGPTAGYQEVSASGFHGTVSGSGTPSVTGKWEMVPGPLGTGLTLLPDGTTAPSGSRPFTVDLSGFRLGGQLSVSF